MEAKGQICHLGYPHGSATLRITTDQISNKKSYQQKKMGSKTHQ